MSTRKDSIARALVIPSGVIIFIIGFSVLVWNAVNIPGAEATGMFGLLLAWSGAAALIYYFNIANRNYVIQSEFAKLQENIGSAGGMNELGLVEIRKDSTIYDYTDIIIKPRNLVIILNHGQTWVSLHIDRLRKRLSDPTKETTFFFVHPNSPLVSAVARKASMEPSAFVGKVNETVARINEIKHPQTKVNIYGHYLYNTYSACIGDTEAVITPYYISRGIRTVPSFRFADIGDECVFRELVEDAKRLKLDAAHIEVPASANSTADITKIVPISKSS